MFLFGVLLFVIGFRTFREYRLLTDTPMVPIRSAPMGLVHVRRTPRGEDRLTSPLTRVPCYYYRVNVEKWTEKDDKGEWETVRTDTAERKFHLEDATGKVLVDPNRADYELADSFRIETGSRRKVSRFVDPSLGVPGPTEHELFAYLTGDLDQAREALSSAHVPGAKILDAALGLGAKLESLGVSMGVGGVSMGFGDQAYRFTESCLPADRECNVLGTYAENPNPGDSHDRNIIKRGENEKTLMITTKSEQPVETSFGRRGFAMVVIGGALIVGSAAIAMHYAGML